MKIGAIIAEFARRWKRPSENGLQCGFLFLPARYPHEAVRRFRLLRRRPVVGRRPSRRCRLCGRFGSAAVVCRRFQTFRLCESECAQGRQFHPACAGEFRYAEPVYLERFGGIGRCDADGGYADDGGRRRSFRHVRLVGARYFAGFRRPLRYLPAQSESAFPQRRSGAGRRRGRLVQTADAGQSRATALEILLGGRGGGGNARQPNRPLPLQKTQCRTAHDFGAASRVFAQKLPAGFGKGRQHRPHRFRPLPFGENRFRPPERVCPRQKLLGARFALAARHVQLRHRALPLPARPDHAD